MTEPPFWLKEKKKKAQCEWPRKKVHKWHQPSVDRPSWSGPAIAIQPFFNTSPQITKSALRTHFNYPVLSCACFQVLSCLPAALQWSLGSVWNLVCDIHSLTHWLPSSDSHTWLFKTTQWLPIKIGPKPNACTHQLIPAVSHPTSPACSILYS